MAVHYDHGTVLDVADVDSDGRLDVFFVDQLGGNSALAKPGRRQI
jgi:hypothetical protein